MNCRITGCDRRVKAKLLCGLHYDRSLRRPLTDNEAPPRFKNKGLTCSVAECFLPAESVGLCRAHFHRKRRGKPLNGPFRKYPTPGSENCCVPGCTELTRHLQYCKFHYHRYRRGTPLTKPRHDELRKIGYVSNGYRWMTTDDGSVVAQHRLVMEKTIGRRLLERENVHHLNGDRLDNRPENLELWSRYQPPGQRIEDKVKYAREILRLYGALFPET